MEIRFRKDSGKEKKNVFYWPSVTELDRLTFQTLMRRVFVIESS